MKYPIGIKLLALLLAALALTSAAGFLMCGFIAIENDLYSYSSLEDWKKNQQSELGEALAGHLAESYGQQALLEVSHHLLDDSFVPDYIDLCGWYNLQENTWHYTITDGHGNLLDQSTQQTELGTMLTFSVVTNHWTRLEDATNADKTYYDRNTATHYYFDNIPEAEFLVTIWFDEDVQLDRYGFPPELLQPSFLLRNSFPWLILLSLAVFAGCLVYLCFAAGKKAAADLPTPGGLNRLPLDFYLAAAAAGCFGLIALSAQCINFSTEQDYGFQDLMLIFAAGGVFLTGLLATAFLFALAAQTKGHTGYWWRNSILGRVLKLLWKGLRYFFQAVTRILSLLPLIWQWLLILIAELFFIALSIYAQSVFLLVWSTLLLLLTVGYVAYACGTLLSGMQELVKGNLHTKISSKFLTGSFAQGAENLNALAQVAVTAAKKQMHSERMKTELIANVSHDIKTPLTSIINYVDLLGSTDSDEEKKTYLEVLARQSLQMKRLLEDLLEMSKAASGNLTVDVSPLDAVETVNQALGEYADRLAQKDLHVVFPTPDTPVRILADGRLTWRVLNNLLSNVVKYALPNTRVYLSLGQENSRITLSLKNISQEALNVPAEELMERFVRGDASRNTEGSGLGLNIAQSLMEAQGGHLQLYVDGDLFKVTLFFPESK